ncbi:hypothetical protein [Flavobacterium sp. CAU 1735]|uniref:hypothetical protein n=1 Tax=Flavobacterium sp. CAU 1735 TaxID=3140361 RepID=UPI003260710D
MKVFLSYSLNNNDQFILTLLAEELTSRGFSITQSSDFNTEMSPITKNNIAKSNFFIGLISGKGHKIKRVENEWQLAYSATIPGILIVEDTVPATINLKSHCIFFNRNHPNQAIQELNEKIENMKSKINNDSNAWPWILGGAALISLISLLNKDEKKIS